MAVLLIVLLSSNLYVVLCHNFLCLFKYTNEELFLLELSFIVNVYVLFFFTFNPFSPLSFRVTSFASPSFTSLFGISPLYISLDPSSNFLGYKKFYDYICCAVPIMQVFQFMHNNVNTSY